jgi:hypothetical protein
MNTLKRTNIEIKTITDFMEVLIKGYAVRNYINMLSVIHFIYNGNMYVTNNLGTYKMSSNECEFFPAIPEDWKNIIVYEVEIQNINDEWFFKTVLDDKQFPTDLQHLVGSVSDFGKITLFSDNNALADELTRDNFDDNVDSYNWKNIQFIKLN